MRVLMKFAFGIVLASALAAPAAMAAWEPEKPVELIVPAGVGGGLDKMARLIQDIVIKHRLMRQDLVLVNKPGGAGTEGFLLIKTGIEGAPYNAAGTVNPHRIMIAGNGIFTNPLHLGVPFNWKDFSPVATLGFEPFILWTHSNSGYKSAKVYIDAVKAAGPGRMKMGGTGLNQEWSYLTWGIEKASGTRFSYIPFKGRENTVLGLVARQVDSTVSSPAEATAHWRADALIPLCVFNEARLPYSVKVTKTMSWRDVPTCKETGIDVSFQLLRGIFMGPGVTAEQTSYFISVFKKIIETPEWKTFMEEGAYSPTFLTGREFTGLLAEMDSTHKAFMRQPCGFGGCK